MPLYGDTTKSPVALIPGQNLKLFDAETPSAGQSSIAFNRSPAPGDQVPSPIVFTFAFASAPTAVVTVQGSNDNVEANFQDLYTSTSLQHDFYADQGIFAWYRYHCVSYSAGGAFTGAVQR